MKEKIYKLLITEMHPVYMNGIAMVGWITAAMYGLACVIKELWTAFR